MTNAKCSIWGTPAIEAPSFGDGRFMDSPRAGGKYFISGTAVKVLESCDDRLKACLTSWLVEQRRLGIVRPEIDSRTISEVQRRKPLGIPERAHGILLYLETRSDHLGDEVTYRVFLDLYDKSPTTLTRPEREYFGLLSHSESINKKELFFLLDYLDRSALIENITSDDRGGGCILTANGYARLKAEGYRYGQATRSFPSNGEWDVFISHASEDKDDFVRPLAEGLEQRDLRVWFDESTLKVGDSLREAIDHGLGQSRFGIVVLSQHFFSKQWPQNELDGLLAREVDGLKVILPVWHKITRAQVEDFSPILAGRIAARSEQSLDQVIEGLTQVIGTSATDSKPASSARPPEIPRQPAADHAERASRQMFSTAVPSEDPRGDVISDDKLREAERTVVEADQAAELVAAKYERSPDFVNSQDLKRGVHVLRNPDEAYKFILQTGYTPHPMSIPSDIKEAWDRQKKARDVRFNARQQPLIRTDD